MEYTGSVPNGIRLVCISCQDKDLRHFPHDNTVRRDLGIFKKPHVPGPPFCRPARTRGRRPTISSCCITRYAYPNAIRKRPQVSGFWVSRELLVVRQPVVEGVLAAPLRFVTLCAARSYGISVLCPPKSPRQKGKDPPRAQQNLGDATVAHLAGGLVRRALLTATRSAE